MREERISRPPRLSHNQPGGKRFTKKERKTSVQLAHTVVVDSLYTAQDHHNFLRQVLRIPLIVIWRVYTFTLSPWTQIIIAERKIQVYLGICEERRRYLPAGMTTASHACVRLQEDYDDHTLPKTHSYHTGNERTCINHSSRITDTSCTENKLVSQTFCTAIRVVQVSCWCPNGRMQLCVLQQSFQGSARLPLCMQNFIPVAFRQLLKRENTNYITNLSMCLPGK